MSPYLKKTLQILGLYLLFIALCRVTQGHAMIGIILIGCGAALMNKRGWALFYYLMIPMLTAVSYHIMPRSGMFNMYCRIGTVVMAFLLWIAARGTAEKRIVPLLGLLVYLVIEAFSSIQGYYPLISFLKILNFSAFIMGIYLGTSNLHHHPEDILLLRATFMAFAIFLVFGSLLTLPFPTIAYATSVGYYLQVGDIEGAEQALRTNTMALFSGVTWHSQALSPMLAMVNGWLLSDMLFIEKKITKLHGFLLLAIPIMLYMTRSRAGFFSYAVSMVMIGFYAMPRSQITFALRGRMRSLFLLFTILISIGGIVMEVRNQSMSRWLRKTDEVEADQRSFGEALTASRLGAVEDAMIDFQSHPLFGIGFQVSRDMKDRQWGTSLFSAPIEKGLLPMVVLSEAGIIGSIVFVIFLFHFWMVCSRQRYIITFCLFVVFLATNMGEATFFSPSAGGGILWILSAAGGFLLDTSVWMEQNIRRTIFLQAIGRG